MLAAPHFGDVFGRAGVYQLPLGLSPSGRRRQGIPQQRYGASAIPLFIVRGPGDVVICTVAKPLSPKLGHTLISLVDPNDEQSRNYRFAFTVLVKSITGLVAENAVSSPISVRRKEHMYSIETPEAKPAPSTFRDPVIPESTDAQTDAAGDASSVTTAGSMVGDLLDSRLNNL